MTSNINFEPKFLILRKAYFNPEEYMLDFRVFFESAREDKRKEELDKLLKIYNPPLNWKKKDIPFTLDETIEKGTLPPKKMKTYNYISSLVLSGKK